MQNKHRFLLFSLAGLLVALLMSAAGKPVSGAGPAGSRFYESRQDKLTSGSEQGSPCMAILMEAVNKAGVRGTIWNSYTVDKIDENGIQVCAVQFIYEFGNAHDNTSTILLLYDSLPTPEHSCEFVEFAPPVQFQLTTFHGYNAETVYFKNADVSGEPSTKEIKRIFWCMYKGERYYNFEVTTTSNHIEMVGPAQDPLPIADVLWSIAEDRLPLSEVPVDSTEQPALPVNPGEVVPGQPEVPTDQTVPTDTSTPTETGGLFGIPLAVILGSLGIPVAGAVAGAALSAILSGLSSAGVSSAAVTNVGASLASGADKPIVEPIEANDQGLYWSERPWDEAGPGYVSKEEYERTKDMLEQGYKWTNGGWQTPGEIRQSDQWQQNNRAATAREDAELQAKMEAEQQALEQNEAELKKTADELQAASKMIDLNHSLMAINQDVLDANIYVMNPYQGDPTLIGHGLVVTKNIVWDNTVGLYTGSNGMTCGEYVDQTFSTVKYVVNTQYGPEATVQSIKFAERSTIDPRREWLDPGKYKDFFDSIIEDNHNLIKVTLPDDSEWAVDFHQHNTGNRPPVLRPWAEAVKEWKTYLGEHEFIISTIGQ